MVKILAEIHFVDALVAEQSTGKKVMSQADSVAVYGPIFAKYNASFSQLHSSLMPYVGNKEKMAVLYEKVVKILEKNEKKYAEQLAVYQKEQERLLNLEIDAQHHYCR
ncbi:hypothetical protein FACS189467_8210 [Bacteroidia bacterium]|nr:hypothetical protein FACS189467_8210 [Bacteroidia bacterium]